MDDHSFLAQRPRPVVALATSLVLALVLGVTTFVGWVLVGREAYQGGIPHAIAERGLLIYSVLAALWAAVGVAAGRWLPLPGGGKELALVATLAWLVQGGIVVFFGEVISNELRSMPFNASIWLVATGLVLQPIAVIAGALLGRSRAAHGRRPARD